MLKILNFIIFTFLLWSCVDPFDPDFSGTPIQSSLVVDGLINNDSTAQEIVLSRSQPISVNTGFFRESGATVTLKDNEDNCFQLREERNGSYFTDPDDFQAEIGKSYQLEIQLSNGEEYYSDFQEMLPVAPIDSIWFLLEEESFLVSDFIRSILALNIYEKINGDQEPSYMQYEYKGTYEIESPLQGNSICWRNPSEVPADIQDTLVCYIDESIRLPLNFFSINSDNYNTTTDGLKILTLSSDRRFELGYSMVIKKSSLTEDYYNFMSEVKAQTAYGGGLFDPPPTEIQGNIVSKANPDERALGFFSTRVSTAKRIFIDGVQAIQDTSGLSCDYDPFAIPPEIPPFTSCCDCRLYPNATDVQPDFWPAL